MIRSYAVITAVRDEAPNLPRLAAALAAQTMLPAIWLIVDNGSTDGTIKCANELHSTHDWVRPLSVPGAETPDRGAPVVRALNAALAELSADPPEIVVNVDADVSFEPDYFERLLAEFDADPKLGIASGSAFELEGGVWRQRHVTGTTVWGASRAYRWSCLDMILPFEPRVGWDGIDEFKANAQGWETRAFPELAFRHHRREGERDGARWRARMNQGRAAHYLGYRPWYLVLRAIWNARREPSSLAMILGYAAAVGRREQRTKDASARAYLRSQQSPKRLRSRLDEALGRREPVG